MTKEEKELEAIPLDLAAKVLEDLINEECRFSTTEIEQASEGIEHAVEMLRWLAKRLEKETGRHYTDWLGDADTDQDI